MPYGYPYYLGIYDALIKVNTGGGIRAHHQTSRAHAGVAPQVVDALPSVAGVLQARTLVDVGTAGPVKQQHVPRVATAAVGPGRVKTEVVAAAIVGGTLVYILTGQPPANLPVALVADALVAPHHVLAYTIRTNAARPAALVHVFAVTAVVGQLVARGTLALEGTRGVYAPASPTQGTVSRTLVDIHADLHHRGHVESSFAVAGEPSLNVDAGSVAADSVHDAALINVHAPHPVLVQSIALVAAAAERTN